jgi:hypothetical protein
MTLQQGAVARVDPDQTRRSHALVSVVPSRSCDPCAPGVIMMPKAVLAGLIWLASTVLSAAGAAETGAWQFSEARHWAFSPNPNADDRTYGQTISDLGIDYAFTIRDGDGKVWEHTVLLGWAFDRPMQTLEPGETIGVTVKLRHEGHFYSSADASVYVGDYPRQEAYGWRPDGSVSLWGWRTDAVVYVTASNGTAVGTGRFTVPSAPAAVAMDEPFPIIFVTGIQGAAGVELLYHWVPSGAAPQEME